MPVPASKAVSDKPFSVRVVAPLYKYDDAFPKSAWSGVFSCN